jgi:hypothetical protein
MLIREQPVPTRTGECVSFTGSFPVNGQDDPAAIAVAVRTWVRQKKVGLMRDFTVLDAYGENAAYSVSLILEGQPSFPVHTALGRLGFRLDNAKGSVSYRLPLISNWKANTPAARFERELQAPVPRVLPLERCREVAERVAERFASAFNVALDYSASSLATLSRALAQRESGGLSPVVYLPSTIIGAGCYLGEVLIREVAGSAWMERVDETGCNFTLGPTRGNPWMRILDLCVRGSEAALVGNLQEVLCSNRTSADAWANAWD